MAHLATFLPARSGAPAPPRRHRLFRPAVVALIAGLLAAIGCRDAVAPDRARSAPPPPEAPSFQLSDGTTNGNRHFYFLSPVVAAPTFVGTFDAVLLPQLTVRICALAVPAAPPGAPAACGAEVVAYGSTTKPPLTLDTKRQQYAVTVLTKGLLSATTDYRIRVYATPPGGTAMLLGFSDVDVVPKPKDVAGVRPGFVGVVEGLPMTIAFRVETGVVAGVAVAPATASVRTGSTQAFTATLTDLHGAPLAGPSVAWASTVPATATVAATGVATGVAPGTTTITATSEGVSGAATLTVTPPPDAAPFVVETSPRDGETGVSPSPGFRVLFSERVATDASAFRLECPAGVFPALAVMASKDQTTFTFSVTSPLPPLAACVLTVNASSVKDLDTDDPPDNMQQNVVVSFTVGAPPPDDAPSVTGTFPADGATDVPNSTSVRVYFSEDVSLTTKPVVECPVGAPQAVSSAVVEPRAVTLTFVSPLPQGVCVVTVRASTVTDVDLDDPPDFMAADYTSSFSVAQDAAPYVLSIRPGPGEGVRSSAQIYITFSEPVSATPGAFSLECPAGTPVGFQLSGGGSGFTLSPTSLLPTNTKCSVTVFAAGITDLDPDDPPDTMLSDFFSSFSVLPDP